MNNVLLRRIMSKHELRVEFALNSSLETTINIQIRFKFSSIILFFCFVFSPFIFCAVHIDVARRKCFNLYNNALGTQYGSEYIGYVWCVRWLLVRGRLHGDDDDDDVHTKWNRILFVFSFLYFPYSAATVTAAGMVVVTVAAAAFVDIFEQFVYCACMAGPNSIGFLASQRWKAKYHARRRGDDIWTFSPFHQMILNVRQTPTTTHYGEIGLRRFFRFPRQTSSFHLTLL